MAIAAAFLIAGYIAYTVQIGKGRDAKRQDDLHRIRNAFENYYNDNGCYPSSNVLADCGGDSFTPYLPTIPCDPESKEPYLCVVDSATCPSWHYVFSDIEYKENLTNECRDGCNFEGIDATYYYYVYGGAPPEPYELDNFIGFGDSSTTVDCLVGGGCFKYDSAGNCNVAVSCSVSEDCFSEPTCSEESSIDCCY